MKVLCNRKATNAEREISFFKSFEDVDLEVFETRKSFLKKIEILAGKKEKIVVMGGDGTVSLAAQKIAGTDTALGIIPVGRGNDFTNFLGIPSDPLEALWVAKRGNKTKVSLGGVDSRYFCNSFGVGFDAYVIGLTERYNKKSYKLTAIKNLFKFESFNASISARLRDGSHLEISEDFLMIVFANGITEGNGLHVSHKGLEDQHLSMTTVYDLNGLERLLTLPFFFTFGFDKPESVKNYQIKEAELKVSRDIRKQVDGDIFYGGATKVKAYPRAVTVLT